MSAVIPAITRLSSRVVRVLGCNPGPMTLQGTNTYLIGTGKQRILLDTGDKDVEEYQHHLRSVIEKEDVDISHIVLTHWHRDHIGGVDNIYQKFTKDCKIWKHKKSSDDRSSDELPPSVPLHWLQDGQTLRVEGATLKIHHTPGHTTDHVVLTLEEDNVLFSGDCVLGEGTAVFEDLYTYMQSLKRILELKPDLIYPGHGNVVEKPIQHIEYYIKHRNERESQILEALRSNPDKRLTEMELVKLIYTETPEELWKAAAYNVKHHLTKLTLEHRATVTQTDGVCRWQCVPAASL